MLSTFLNGVVLILQLAIAALAIWVVKVTGRSVAWITIAGAVLFLSLLQILQWAGLVTENIHLDALYQSNEMLFLTGAVILLGFAAVVQQFQKLSRSNEELEKSQHDLRERETRLRMITEQIPGIVVTYDTDLRIISLSGSALNLFNIKAEDRVGMLPHEFLQTRDPNHQVLVTLRRALSGESFSEEMCWKGVYFLSRFDPMRDENGNITGVISVGWNITEQKQAQQALHRSREQLRLIVDTALDAIVSIDSDGSITDWNPQAEIIFGWKRGEIVGKNIAETIIPERFRDAHKQGFAHYLRTGESTILNKRVEFFARHHDGYEFPIEMSISPMRIGDKLWFSAFIRDITARNVADEALRESEERMELAVKGAGLGLWDWEIPTNTKSMNRRWAEMLGFELEEIEPRIEGWSTLVHPDDLPRVQQLLQAHFENKTAYYEAEYRMKSKSGEWKWILDTGKVVERSQSGEPLRMTGTHRDITERVLAEEMATRFGRILDDSKNEIYVFHEGSLCFLQANRGAIENTQYTMDELRDMTPLNLMPDFTRERFLEILESLRDNTERSIHFTAEQRRKDGTLYPVEINLQQTVHESSPVYAAIVLDVTERKRAEEERRNLEAQLRRTQKLETIGTLAGGIAHDFNNILTPILGYTDMAMAAVPSESRARVDLEHVVRAAKRARDLVKQILTFSRQVDQERRPIRIDFIVEEALKLLRASLPASIEIKYTADDDCGSVVADASQIHQVIMNLCTNAYHAMREKNPGLLEVQLERTVIDEKIRRLRPSLAAGPYVRLRVRDNGCGMDSATIERIFEPFFTTKGVGEGTGLGLSVVHGIILNHGGDILVSSKIGVGTTFDVVLPEAMEIPNVMQRETMGPAPRGSERVLFVDDEEEIAYMAKELLERLGYQVTIRTSSLEALHAFRAKPNSFDVIVTDQNMPQMTGFQFASELLRIRPEIPVILITGFSETVTPEACRQAGIRDFVMKPVVARDLSRAIRRAVDGEKVSV